MSSRARCCRAARSVIAPGQRDRATGECIGQGLLARATTEARGASGVRLLAHRSGAAACVPNPRRLAHCCREDCRRLDFPRRTVRAQPPLRPTIARLRR
eukprot:scaffold67606_cov67-Phaeocystis_antarctica.AAC.9